MVLNKKKKKKKKLKFQASISILINLCRAAMQVFHLNNKGFFALNDQLFIPANVMIQKIRNSVDFFLENFYRFVTIIILELQLNKILLYLTVSKLWTPKL